MSMNQRFHNIVRKLKLGAGGGTVQKAGHRRSADNEKDNLKSSEIDPPEALVDHLTFLPTELFFCVTSYLSDIECWCLALTCRNTYLLLTREQRLPPIKDPERLFELLLVLELDLPKHIACQPSSHLHSHHSQPFLHTWNKIDSLPKTSADSKLTIEQFGCQDSLLATQAQGLRYHNPPSNPENNKNKQEPEPPKWFVSEELRRLILRHELIGKDYGIPISILDFQMRSDDKASSSTPSWKIKIESRLTGTGSLMIHRSTSYQTKIFDARNPYRVPNAEQLRQCLCRHMTPDLSVLLFRYMIKLLYTYRDNQPAQNNQSLWPSVHRPRYPSYPKNWIHHPRLLKCQICATDISCRSKVRIRSPTPVIGDDNNHSKVKVGNGEVEYWSEVVFDVYHDLGGLGVRKPLTRAQQNVVQDMSGEQLSTAEADERLREALELRWLGRQRSWKDNITKKNPSRIVEADYTAEGVYAKEGVPEDVCFLRTRGAGRLNVAALNEPAWTTHPPAQQTGQPTA